MEDNNIYSNNYSDYESKLNNFNKQDDNRKHKREKKLFSFELNVVNILLILIAIAVIVLSIIIIKNLLISYKVKFYLNGASVIDADEMKCKSNVKGHCYLTLPNVKRYDGEIIGFAHSPESKEADYQVGTEIEVFNDMELYVISKKENVLNIDESDVNDVDATKEELTCITYNLENICSIEVPKFNKVGYENLGYSEIKGSKTVTIHPGDKVAANKTIYPIYDVFQNKKTITAKRSFAIDKAYVDVETSCPDDIANSLSNYIKIIEEKLPFYFNYNKVIFHGSSAFNVFIKPMIGNKKPDSVGGITFGVYDAHKTFSVRCTTEYDVYLVLVHELSHAYDYLYKSVLGSFISDNSDIRQLYNKYVKASNRPLSDYAYSSYKEFYAELMAHYYINYIDTSYTIIEPKLFKRGNFPDDLKKAAEKYICIGKNDFDKSKCEGL